MHSILKQCGGVAAQNLKCALVEIQRPLGLWRRFCLWDWLRLWLRLRLWLWLRLGLLLAHYP